MSNQSLYRSEALDYRLRTQGRRQSVVMFPRWMTRRFVIALWFVLGLLGVSGGAACFAKIPVSGSGMAIVTGEAWPSGESVLVSVLMPQEYEHRIVPGVNARVFTPAADDPVKGVVASVDPTPLSTSAAERRLGLPESSLAMLDAPVFLVEISVDPAKTGILVPGTTVQAELPVGSRYAGSFLPLVGRLFRSES